MKKTKLAIISISFSILLGFAYQNVLGQDAGVLPGDPFKTLTGNVITPRIASSTIRIPSLGTTTSNNHVLVNASGTLILGAGGTGTGGGTNTATATINGMQPNNGIFYFVAGTNVTISTSTTATSSLLTINASVSGGTGTVTTSTPATAGYFPYWGTTSALTGTSSIFQLNGNVGISNINPSQALDVTGNGLFSGDVNAVSSTLTGQLNVGSFIYYPSTTDPAEQSSGVLLHATTIQGHSLLMTVDQCGYHNKINEDNYFIAKNVSGSVLATGTVVYATAQSAGAIPTIDRAQANSTSTLPALGILEERLANNAFGCVMKTGLYSPIDTSAFATGDRLFVSPTASGTFTNVRPTYPYIVQRMGSVLNSGVGNGSLLVVTAPTELGRETGTISSTFTIGGVLALTSSTLASFLANSTGIGLSTVNGVSTFTNTAPNFNTTTSINGLTGALTNLSIFNGTTTVTASSGIAVVQTGNTYSVRNTAPNFNTTTSINGLTGALTNLSIFNGTTTVTASSGIAVVQTGNTYSVMNTAPNFNTTTTLTASSGITIAQNGGTYSILNSAPNFNTTTTINGLSGAITANIFNTTTSLNGLTGAITGLNIWNTTTTISGLTGNVIFTASSSISIVTSTVDNSVRLGAKNYPIQWTLRNETSNQKDCFFDANTTTTISAVRGHQGSTGDSVSFNFAVASSSIIATTSMSNLFTTMQTSNQTTSTVFSINGTSVIGLGQMLCYFSNVASTSATADSSWTFYYSEN